MLYPPSFPVAFDPNAKHNCHVACRLSRLEQKSYLLSASPSTSPCPANGRPASCQTHTTTTDVAASEHGRIPIHFVSKVARVLKQSPFDLRHRKHLPQHVWDNEEPNVTASNVDLLQMADSSIARRHRNVLELHVHVVFGYSIN